MDKRNKLKIMKTTDAVKTIKKNCVSINLYITDAFESPYCGLIGKVFCDKKKTAFERDVHSFVEKYKDIKKPDLDESTALLTGMLDICQKYESVKSDKFITPSANLNITIGEDYTIEDLGISTTLDKFEL